jgi:HTH-type transcriptional regulator/antitoxin HigA
MEGPEVSVGEILAEELDARGWTQAEFAEVLDRPLQFVSEILNNKKQLTRESAAQIGAAFGSSAEVWLNLQDQYYLARQRRDDLTQARLDEVRRRAALRQFYPIVALAQRGLIHATDSRQQERDILDLYEIEELGQRADFALAARRSNVAERLTPTQEGWFVAVRKKARSARVGPFDRSALAALAPKLPRALKSPKDFAGLPSKLAAVGVRLVHVEAFPSSKIDGCAFILDGVPVIGLSGRGRRLDKVLFTLLHEVAHLVLDHVGENPIVEDADEAAAPEDDMESAADELAQVWALPGGLPGEPFRVSEAWVTTTAERADVNPIVVIGRLQFSGLLSWRTSLVKNAPTVAAQLAEWK